MQAVTALRHAAASSTETNLPGAAGRCVHRDRGGRRIDRRLDLALNSLFESDTHAARRALTRIKATTQVL